MKTECYRWLYTGVCLLWLGAAAAVGQEQVVTNTAKQLELEARSEELDKLESDLKAREQELATAEEKRSNLQLRQAVLDARKTLISWRRAEEQFVLNKKLGEKGIVSPREVTTSREASENAELAYKNALLTLEQTRLDILKDAAVISVVEARVYRTDSVKKAVDVTLANMSNIGRARVAYYDADDEKISSMLRVPDIRVSLRSGAIVAEPYSQSVDLLGLDQTETLTFELLQGDLERLTVEISYFDKVIREDVFLKKDSENDIPDVRSANFDQTGQLGQTITYGLVLERLAETEKIYSLTTLNLPSELKVQFRDKDNKATVSAVKFAQDVTRKNVDLEVIIPAEMPQEKLDVPVEFYVLVLDEAGRERLLELKREQGEEGVSAEQLTASRLAFEKLVFTPRGIGQVELSSPDLYNEITVGEQLEIRFNVENTGTVPLRNIRMQLELPADWEANMNPEVVRELDIAEEAVVRMTLYPAPDLGVGDYAIRVDGEASYEGQDIVIDDKIVRVHVESKANVVGGVLLIVILGGALLGLSVFLVRLARR